jgi:hypothetical protein
LHDLIARARPGVAQHERNAHFTPESQLSDVGGQLRKLEARIAQAVAEGVLRLALQVQIGTVLAQIVVEHGRELLE